MSDNRRIITTAILSDEYKNDVLKLLEICQKTHGTDEVCFMEDEINALLDMPCYYLAYEGEKLVCFISVFTPDEISCEIYSLTHPGYENSNIFELLINTAIETAEAEGIEDVFFVTDSADSINSDYMKRYYIETDSSTMLMELEINYPYAFKGILGSNEFIYDVKSEVTEDNDEGSINHNLKFYSKGELIGFAQCEQYPNAFCIHHVEVVEPLRQKGHGKELLSDTISYCLGIYSETSTGKKPVKFILNVDTDNEAAVKLYKGFNFNCTEQIDYYYI